MECEFVLLLLVAVLGDVLLMRLKDNVISYSKLSATKEIRSTSKCGNNLTYVLLYVLVGVSWEANTTRIYRLSSVSDVNTSTTLKPITPHLSQTIHGHLHLILNLIFF